MIRRIIDINKISDEVLALLVTKFPEGIDEDEIFSIQNKEGKIIRVVEVRDEQSIYLVKVSSKLGEVMEEFETDEDDSGRGFDDPDELDDKLG